MAHQPCTGLRAILCFVGLLACCRETTTAQGGPPASEPAPLKSETESESSAAPATGRRWFSGSIMLFSDFYGLSPTGQPIAARRPTSLHRLIFAPTIYVGDVEIPIYFLLSTNQTNVTTPVAPNQSFSQFVQNPMNYLNVSPSYKWIQLHFGSQVPRFSELSIGDLQLFGIGAELSPGKLYVQGVVGASQRAIEPDSTLFVPGAYARTIYAAKLGIGYRDSSRLDFNFVRAVDDTTSVQHVPVGITPQEGVLGSINAVVVIAEGFSLSGEGALSAFTRSTRTPPLANGDLSFLDPLITVREATRFDGAAVITAAVDRPGWGISATARYLGPGFVPLGYQYLEPDRLEFIVAPHAALLDNRLTISGSLGHRTNNLLGTNAETARQIIGSLNCFWQITGELGFAAGYSNYGVRSSATNDTLRIESISQNISLSPLYTFASESAQHTVTVTVGLDNFEDRNVVTGARNSNRTTTLQLGYAVSLVNTPLSGDVSYTNFHNNLPAGSQAINSVHAGASYRLSGGAIVPSLGVTFGSATLGSNSSDTQLQLRGGCTYNITSSLTATLSASVQAYKYGSAHPGDSFTESLVQSSVAVRL
jgi:hypothetical protein